VELNCAANISVTRSVADAYGDDDRAACFRDVLYSLPIPNRETIIFLFNHLYRYCGLFLEERQSVSARPTRLAFLSL